MKIRFLFFALLFSFLTVNTTHATPFLYTFKGNVQFLIINEDPNLTIDDYLFLDSYLVAGVSIGELAPITYSFVVDLEREGFCSPAGADQCDYDDGIPRDEIGSDYFYVALDDASIEIPIDYEGTNFNFGLRLSNTSGEVIETRLNAGSAIWVETFNPPESGLLKTMFELYSFPAASDISKDITLWDSTDTPLVGGLVGVEAWDGFYDNKYYSGTMYSLLDLISIDPIATVPEPSTLLLMLLALFYIARRRFCNIMNTFHFRA